ncbi:MAG: UDP-N-acetylmuramate dehydrogenase [Rhodocyclaceae bacterium]|nr:UDP-N-acetylmuramate dehydrogenase [Rhodocyclaceae bacterium]MBX3669396.1 UDP-N-acetylmuramate dehydrogenase [Rhodocyclaceae bacterium]
MQIIDQQDLTGCNSFRLPARAARYARAETLDDVHHALAEARGLPLVPLGGGSNVLLRPYIDAFVLHLALPGRVLADEDSDAWYVRAEAGADWHEFVQWTLANNWPGLENLSLIPGTVGAAPIQNIGAYGLELESRLHSVETVHIASGEGCSFARADCRFAYRDSIFKREQAGRHVITAVTFRLPKAWQPALHYRELAQELELRGIGHPAPADVAAAVIAIRRRKLPDWRQIGNAGSFFKNPVVTAAYAAQLQHTHPGMPHYPQADGSAKLAAGWLIEQCGWKGRSLGRAGVYEKQALVLVNRGGADADDVLELAAHIAADVAARFGVELEREPVLI